MIGQRECGESREKVSCIDYAPEVRKAVVAVSVWVHCTIIIIMRGDIKYKKLLFKIFFLFDWYSVHHQWQNHCTNVMLHWWRSTWSASLDFSIRVTTTIMITNTSIFIIGVRMITITIIIIIIIAWSVQLLCWCCSVAWLLGCPIDRVFIEASVAAYLPAYLLLMAFMSPTLWLAVRFQFPAVLWHALAEILHTHTYIHIYVCICTFVAYNLTMGEFLRFLLHFIHSFIS